LLNKAIGVFFDDVVVFFDEVPPITSASKILM
jgi:hypothetical protein